MFGMKQREKERISAEAERLESVMKKLGPAPLHVFDVDGMLIEAFSYEITENGVTFHEGAYSLGWFSGYLSPPIPYPKLATYPVHSIAAGQWKQIVWVRDEEPNP